MPTLTTDYSAAWQAARMRVYLDTAQVAKRLDVNAATVRSWKSRKQMPPPDVMVGDTPGWLPKTIDDWHAGRPSVTPGTGPRKAAPKPAAKAKPATKRKP